MSEQNDFGYDTETWATANSYLESASNDIKAFDDEMTQIVKNSLLQAGFSGDTAEALAE